MAETFNDFNFKPFVNEAIKDLKFTVPTPVQTKVIPLVRHGKSVIGQSQTGSGKTHAFLLPIFDQIDPEKNEVQVVITTPSRELAYQIYEAAKQIAEFGSDKLIVHNYVGGTDKTRQIEQLKRNQPQIIVGTPGRIWDLISAQALDVHTAKQFVIDEADMTLDMGFLDQVDKIAGSLPEDLQMMVFSATIPEKLKPFLRKYMNNPVTEEIPVTSVINPDVDNWLLSTKGKSKNALIHRLVTMGDPYLVLIFANTKTRVEEINHFLQKQGLKVAMIHGDIKPRERKRVMRQVHNLEFQFVVATDLAARGIDIDGVSMVINDEIPTDLDFFIHRVGRTGRKGMDGIAVTLYEPGDDKAVVALEQLGVKFKDKEIKNDEIVDTYDRLRRTKRKPKQAELDITMKGYVKKVKKTVKPGYKKKIKGAIADQAIQKRRIEQRAEFKRAKKAKKSSNR